MIPMSETFPARDVALAFARWLKSEAEYVLVEDGYGADESWSPMVTKDTAEQIADKFLADWATGRCVRS
jgi:hypothetical protein